MSTANQLTTSERPFQRPPPPPAVRCEYSCLGPFTGTRSSACLHAAACEQRTTKYMLDRACVHTPYQMALMPGTRSTRWCSCWKQCRPRGCRTR
eukprot:13714736-Alexandrium_andersonii.AAC.1